jgi:hypothetical protein
MRRFWLLLLVVVDSWPILGGPRDARAAAPGCGDEVRPIRSTAAVDDVGESVVAWQETCTTPDGHTASDVVATVSTTPGGFPIAVPVSPAGQQAALSEIAADAPATCGS